MTIWSQTELVEALGRAGLRWSELLQACDQIILFGSRTDGRVDPRSDWDLLCVGEGSPRLGPIDLLWVTPQTLQRPSWLGGELANHIATHGIWLHGEDRWSSDCHLGAEAVRRKARFLARRLTSLGRHWDRLATPFQQRHAVQIRRDLQRHALLTAQTAIPCRPVLDERWSQIEAPEAVLREWAARASVANEFYCRHVVPRILAESRSCLDRASPHSGVHGEAPSVRSSSDQPAKLSAPTLRW